MRNYKTFKDLTNRVTPARGQVISRDRIQSGPFAIIPYTVDSFALGAGSKIIFGEKNWGVSLEYDLSLKTVSATPNEIAVCQIDFKDGLPIEYEIKTFGIDQEIVELKYKDSSWPSPKNVESMSFLIAVVYPYDENLKNIYGESIINGPPRYNGDQIEGSYSALRTTFSAIRIVQTCYGFMLVPTTTL